MRGRARAAAGVAVVVVAAGGLARVLCRDDAASSTGAAHVRAPSAGTTAGAASPLVALRPVPATATPTSSASSPTTASIVPGAASIELDEGAREAARYLAQADRVDDVMALGAAIAGDLEMRARVEAEARRLLGDASPDLRARGHLILAALGVIEPAGWRASLGAERDAAVRARIAGSPPYGRGDAADAAISSALLDVASSDEAPAVRASAVRSLGKRLDDAQVESLVRVLRDDRDPTVRGMAANWLRGTRLAAPAAVRGLLASATRPAEALDVRRASVMALLRIEDRAPGALAQAGGSLEQVQRLLEQVSDDRG